MCVCVFYVVVHFINYSRLIDETIIELFIFQFPETRANGQIEIPLFRTEEGRYLASSKSFVD